MIPILYYDNTPISDMYTNGIGRLSDIISCTCTEERNGIYEIEFKYPVSGKYYGQLAIGRIVSCVPSEDEDRQPFIIYRRSAEISGIVTFNAYHISYLLSYWLMGPGTFSGIVNTFNGFKNSSLFKVGIPEFTFSTDKTSSKTYTIPGVASVKSLLYGREGSILDVFGTGEYKFDKTNVYLYKNRGSDNGVTIRYGKNLLKLDDELNGSDLYGSVVPFWVNPTDQSVFVGDDVRIISDVVWEDENENYITDENETNIEFKQIMRRGAPLDLSTNFQTQPTSTQLYNAAVSWLENNQPWVPKRNITIDFVALWQTEEYKDRAPVERVKLCDTVRIIYEELGVVATAKVIKTVWNVLLDRYDSIEVGQVKSDYRGFNGNLKIGDKVYKIVNGIITTSR